MTIFVDRHAEDAVLAEVRRRMSARRDERGAVGGTLAACEQSFLAFLPYWRFVNRESGGIVNFGNPETGELHIWQGQLDFAEEMMRISWIYALKAGKLGFSEVECAYDGWRLRFGAPNTRVHIFSNIGPSAQEFLDIVRFGLLHLPAWMQLPLLSEERGGDTGHSLKLYGGPEDTRRAVAYSSGKNVSIDQSCQHLHFDEFAHMEHPEITWNAARTTIAPDGTCHIVTRGAGESGYAAELWRAAESGSSQLKPFFRPWDARPDRDERWYAEQEGDLTRRGLYFFAPRTAAEALAGDEENEFIPIELWDSCAEPALARLAPGSSEVVVLGVDAGIKNDCSGAVLVTRHPERHDDVAVRGVRLWTPPAGGEVDLDEVESFIKACCLPKGGCAAGHYAEDRERVPEPVFTVTCPACHPPEGVELILDPPFSVYEVTYDPWQMENSAQRLRKLGINMQPFQQQKERAIADSELRDLIINRRIAHRGNPHLREHIGNAAAEIDREERKIRIKKKAPHRKVDLAVALSMSARRSLVLYL